LLDNEMRAGERRETYPPEKKPKMMATAIRPPGVAAPKIAKHMIPEPQHIKASMLMEPNLSAKMFGMVRPIVDAAFSMASV